MIRSLILNRKKKMRNSSSDLKNRDNRIQDNSKNKRNTFNQNKKKLRKLKTQMLIIRRESKMTN